MVDVDYACKPLTDIEISIDSVEGLPVVLVDRGNCSFVTKVRNVQKIGGKVALIVNDQEDDSTIFALVDDGTGKDIQIPGILITKKEGEIIKDYIRWANVQKDSNSLTNNIILNIDNKPEEKLLEKVEMTLNFMANDKKVYKLLTQLKSNKDIFEGNHINFVPNYVTVAASDYGKSSDNTVANNYCFCGGRYCSYSHNMYSNSFLNSINAENVLIESIRQKCIYSLAYSKYNSHSIYWTYMTEFNKNCLKKNDFNLACSRETIKQIDRKIMFDVEKCYLDSFERDPSQKPEEYTKTCLKNTILEADKGAVSPKLKEALPIINVNNHTFYGSWTSDHVLQALCSNLKHKPDTCFTTLKVFEKSYDFDDLFSFSNNQLICFATILVILNLFVVFYCRRYAARKLDSSLIADADINAKVDSIVSGYLKMKDQR